LESDGRKKIRGDRNMDETMEGIIKRNKKRS